MQPRSAFLGYLKHAAALPASVGEDLDAAIMRKRRLFAAQVEG